MCSSPTGLEIASLLVSLDTIPANMMQTIVRADGLDDVRRLAVASFATIIIAVLAWGHVLL